MSKLDDLYPSWEKVSLTKKGYIFQRELAKQNIKALMLELIMECDSIFGQPDGVAINRNSLIEKVEAL